MSQSWNCHACTYLNETYKDICEICETPKQVKQVKQENMKKTDNEKLVEKILSSPNPEATLKMEESCIIDENERLRKQKADLSKNYGKAYLKEWEKKWGRWAQEH